MANKFKGEIEVEFGLGLPEHTTASRTAYTPPKKGYKVFDTNENRVYTWDGVAWIKTAIGDAAQIVSGAVSGNFAGLDAGGDLTDSGSKASDFATFAQGATADTAVQPGDATSTLTNNDAFVDLANPQSITGIKTFTAKPVATATVDGDGGTTLVTKAYILGKITAATGAVTTDDLTDVDTTTTPLAIGHALFFDGTNFVNRDAIKADISDFVEGDYATFAQGATADTAVQPADATSTLTNNDTFVERAGDTMTGLLVLSADPVAALGAATKQYVDAQVDTVDTLAELTDTTLTAPADGHFLVHDGVDWKNRVVVAADITDGGTVFATGAEGDLASSAVQRGGDTMTGLLVLSADPTAALGAATKQYVDAQVDTVDSLAELTDTTITLAADGDFLRHNGIAWVDTPLVAGDIPDVSATYVTVATAQTITGVKTFTGTNTPTVFNNLGDESANIEIQRLGSTNSTITVDGAGTIWKSTGDANFGMFSTSASMSGANSSQVSVNGTTTTVQGPSATTTWAKLLLTDTNVALFNHDNTVNQGRLDITTTQVELSFNADTAITVTDQNIDITVDSGVVAVSVLTLDDTLVHTKVPAQFGSTVLLNADPTLNLQAATKQYVDAAAGAVAFAINDLTDVTITTVATGNGLFWNGSAWINRDAVKADVSDFVEADYVHVTGAETIAGVKTFSNNVIMNGDLTVNGTTTTINTTDLVVTDNTIVLNDGEAGPGVTAGSAGIEVDRGGATTNATLLWDETTDTFVAGLVGATQTVATSHQEQFVAADFGQALTAAQDETNYDGVGTNGTFVAGDGVGGTAYVALDTITLTDGSVITVDSVDANGDVVTFTVTTAGDPVNTAGVAILQDTTSGTGTSFTLTPGTANTTGPNTYTVGHTIPYTAGQVFLVQTYDSTGDLVTITTNVNQTTGVVQISTAGAAFNGRIIVSK